MDDFLEFFISIILLLVAVTVFVGGIMCGVRALEHPGDVSSCREFSQATGYETKFVDSGFFDYTCLVKTKGDNWAPLDR